MIVRLIGEMSGTRDGREWPPRGSTIDLPDEEAVRLIETKMAAPVALDEQAPVEVAVPTDDTERAVVSTSHRTRVRAPKR